jgi:hypothetical protein
MDFEIVDFYYSLKHKFQLEDELSARWLLAR